MISLAVVKAAPLPPVNFLEEAEKAAAAVGGHSQGASSSSIDDLSSEFAKLKPIKTRPGVAPSNIYPGTPRPDELRTPPTRHDAKHLEKPIDFDSRVPAEKRKRPNRFSFLSRSRD